MSHPAADRNLLFGILALQMDFVRRDALIAAMHAWVLEKTKPLGRILVEQGALTAADGELLEGVVRRHLEKHGNDAERSLAALAAPVVVRAELERLTHSDLHATVPQISATPSAVPDAQASTASVAAEGTRFQILRPHASGGLGEVFVARDGELNREVALKKIHQRHADHPESRARFVREAEITGGLEHPGIVPVYALGHYPDGRPYYAMRFIRGTSLKEAIEAFHQGPTAEGAEERGDGSQRPSAPSAVEFSGLEFRQLIQRFIAVCNAIAYAHSRGVLHRDIKPSNIMLGEFGETLVVDWGLAKQVGSGSWVVGSEANGSPSQPTTDHWSPATDSDWTRAGQALGTPAYMSPEQAAGRLEGIGPASDVYSLGATLYCLLTGQPPFTETDAAAVVNRAQLGDFPPPRQLDRRVPATLEAICLKAMAREPAGRYPSAKALADDLEHWLADEPVAAHAEPWPARLGRWVRHHKGLTGSAAALTIVALTAALASWRVREAADREAKEQELRGLAETERDRADAQRAEAVKQKGEAENQRAGAETQRNLARRYLYFSHISLADRAWQQAQITRMDELLKQTLPESTSGQDLRGFEWYYLARLRQASLRTLQGHTAFVRSVVFSPDGRRLASASGDGTVKVWDAQSGEATLTLKGHAIVASSVAFSPDGQHLAAATEAGTVKLWDAQSGQETLTLTGHTSTVRSVAFSPDGQRLAAASADGTVKVWAAQSGQETLTLTGHTSTVWSVAFSPDSQRLATASQDRTARIWDARTGRESLTLKGHSGPVLSVVFSPDGQRLASSSQDQTIRVWNARSGQETLTLNGHTGVIWGLAYSPDGQRVASASIDGTVKVWDARSGQETFTLKGHASFVQSVAFSPDGQRLASASADQMVKLWDARSGPEALTLKGHAGLVQSVAFNPDGQRLASTGGDGTVRIWDARTGQEAAALKGLTGWAYCVAFSPDGQRLTFGSQDGTVRVWDARCGRETLTLKGHTGDVHSVAFSPDGQRLASASEDRTVKLWDAHTGQEILTLKGHTRRVYFVAYSPNGQQLASASADGTAKVWDANSGQEVLTFTGHTKAVQSVAFSPDGQCLASAAHDGTAKVWDAHTGQEMLALKGHTSPVWCVAYSPDGQRLATASLDGTVKLWDARSGQETLTLNGHTTLVYCVAYSPDGQRLASGSGNGMVRIWDATPVTEAGDLQARAVGYVRFVAETIALKDEMLQQIRQTPTLSEPERRQALALAEDYREIPERLNEACWRVVRWSWARPGAYSLAQRQAEAACQREPENGSFLNTLAFAQYRNGRFDAALETLTKAGPLNKEPHAPHLAFLAMTQFQLGKKADAAATLGRLRDLMKEPRWATDRDAEALWQEAEELLAEKK